MKFVFTILFFVGILINSSAQSVEIKEIDLKEVNTSSTYLKITNQQSEVDKLYDLEVIFFDYSGINTSAYNNIYFEVYLTIDNNPEFIINSSTYAFTESSRSPAFNNLANLYIGYRLLQDFTYKIKIKVTGLDSGNNLVTITESSPWTITSIPDPILGNTICCNQVTVSYPFNPLQINQNNGTNVLTTDGSSITFIQWQKYTNNIWSNISGATQMSYDPPSITSNTQYRRLITTSSGKTSTSNTITITKITERITGNSICCNQTTSFLPIDPAPFLQTSNTILASNIAGTTFTFQWQLSYDTINWVDISGATNASYDSDIVKNPTYYRRVANSSNGTRSFSKITSMLLQPCDRPDEQQNNICGDMTFYKVQNGDLIIPGKILGSYISPNILRREYGFDYMISTDGINWTNAKPKHLLSSNEGVFWTNPNYVCYYFESSNDPKTCAIMKGELDYQMPAFNFDISKGNVQHIYIRRDYYHWYDEFNCGFLNTFSCGSQWHFRSSSNIVTITLTTGDFPKPVPQISGPSQATCNWSDQTMTFSIPQLNNGEYYKWEIPSTWTSYTALEGPYVNQIVINTNSGAKNTANGGQVCLTVTQGGQVDRQCKTVAGTPYFISYIPATPISACEGQTVTLTPIIRGSTGYDPDPNHYTYNWAAYQSPIQSCNNPAGSDLTNCKELKITVSNVRQNPTQPITLTTTSSYGCISTYNFSLITAPGMQMGILNSYNDPKAVSASGLAVDVANNYLYFTGTNNALFRTYFDNTLGQQIWKYVAITDKLTNTPIRSDGPVAFYNGSTSKLLYVLNNNLFYAESTDNGQTWINQAAAGNITSYIDPRIKIWDNNVYYIKNSDRKVYYKSPSIGGTETLVGNMQMNYSQRMFTVEDGLLAYADASNNIVAFDALTGAALTINVPSNIKQVNYNSSISTYNGNIYYTGSNGSIRILKRNASTGIYDNYEETPSFQLAGPFAINKQTGTIYAKAYDVLGKQIYYLNNQWNTLAIQNTLSYSGIQSDMTYANGHAYYIGDNGYISNTYYVAPCTPAVLRQIDLLDATGDIVNQPLSNILKEDHSVLVYPNPTNNQSKVTFSIPQESMVRINLIPITGGSSDILSNSMLEAGTHDINVDVNSFASGIYLLQVYVNGTLYGTSKLIKQ
ncbi:MAG: T9SS type A sorting domain-containing protein [Cytophagaceae bacterium]